jgi:cysteine synthase B
MKYPTLESLIGNTPLVQLQRIGAELGNTLLVKLEGQNPAGSVKDRPAYSMIHHAQERGEIKPGDTLIEATSGNTGIALAMVAAVLGYRMILIMPETMSMERRASMAAYGAELILVSKDEGMEGARDLGEQMQREGKGRLLDQFSNPDNPLAHYETTGPEIWRDTAGEITHFVSSMGTTGTIWEPAGICGSRPIMWRSSASIPMTRPIFPEFAAGPRSTCRQSISPNSSIAFSRSVRRRQRP